MASELVLHDSAGHAGIPDAGIPRTSRLFSLSRKPSLSSFKSLCSRSTPKLLYPLSCDISSNVPIYDLSKYDVEDSSSISDLQDEWHHTLLSGPGVFVLRHMYQDESLLSKVNDVFASIIASEKDSRKGDHFTKGGNNERIWNSFSKHGLSDPVSFLQYYSNPWLAVVCDSWLGPAYRITAQVNIVKPGGAPYPKSMQIASQLLTLQGAIAHCDMPVASGPTRLLPFSQLFEEGFMTYRSSEFIDYFLENHVTLPLERGDGLFFNPALFHAGGENLTNSVQRIANLIQASSAFGKPMENIDSIPLIERVWKDLQDKHETDGMTLEVSSIISAIAEGYPFPTNLDRCPPVSGGLAPESEQDITRRGLEEHWDVETVVRTISQMREDSKA